MSVYTILPAATLRGEVRVDTSKNAVLPILAAGLLTRDTLTVERVPRLSDVDTLLSVLAACGSRVSREGDTVSLAADAPQSPGEHSAMRRMRASVLVLGPLLARCGTASLSLPGGCAIGQRPIDIHIKGMQALGAHVESTAGGVTLSGRLKGANVYLDFPSVGATENVMMAASLAQGATRIENAAKEPEIADLAACLCQMGAHIAGAGTATITVEGVRELHGARYAPIPDRIEAGTLACAAAVTDGSVLLSGARADHMRAVLFKLQETGVLIEDDARGLHIRGKAKHPLEIRTLSYPGFPTDMQAPMMVVALKTPGLSIFLETIFENRYMHVVELSRMGAQIRVDNRLALIEGGAPLRGTDVMSTDLRAAAALVLSGLIAQGVTTLHDDGEHLRRGYAALDEKLRALGADIRREG